MLTYLLGTEETEAPLQELVLQKTEGIPFFIEEFIKSLKDLKLIERKNGAYHLTKDIHDVSIPGTIQDVIMARVDSLPEAARGVLQAGSAIEREFGHDLIKRVMGIPEQELLSHLSALKDSELLYERGIYPQSTYIFRHALTREVVYGSILAAKRKKLHLEIGYAIEDIYKDNLDEHYEALAEHYVTGENYEKGAEYCRLVARKSQKAASFNDAIAYSEKGVACLERLPRSSDVEKQIIDARTTLGLYCAQMNHMVEAREAVDPVLELALKRDYKGRIAQIYIVLGGCALFVDEDFPTSFKYLGEALKISEELNDILSLALSSYWVAVALAWNCEFEKALLHFEKAVEINILLAAERWGTAVMKSTMAWLVYSVQGKCDLAFQTSHEAVRLAEESGDTYSKAPAYASSGIACCIKGCLDEAEGHLLKGSDFCDRINFFSWAAGANQFLGQLYFHKGEYQKSQDFYNRAAAVLKRGRILPSYLNLCRMGLARAKVMINENDVDLKDILESYHENRNKSLGGLMAGCIAEILLNIDDRHIDEAEEWVKKAIEANDSMRLYQGWDYASYAELLRRKGDLPGAREKLNKAIEIYQECGADGWLKKAQEDLAELQKPGRKRTSSSGRRK